LSAPPGYQVDETEIRGTLRGPSAAAEVILVDCSGSMGHPPTKIAAARRATEAAIDLLPDGTLFAVVEGTHEARMAYPATATLAVASDQTRREAKKAAARLVAAGGTAMGAWLAQARDLLAPHPHAVRHALLLTDGRNEHETSAELGQVLETCVGQVYPTVNDLTRHGTTVAERAVEFRVGSWGEESRDYHLCVEVERGAAPMGEDLPRIDRMLAETGSYFSTRSDLERDSRVAVPRQPSGPDRRCVCGSVWPADAIFCEACSRRLVPADEAPSELPREEER